MKNFLGQPLKIGDAVAYIATSQHYIYTKEGVIIYFTHRGNHWPGEMVPVVRSWNRSLPNGYSRRLKSCDLVFPIEKSVEQIKEEQSKYS